MDNQTALQFLLLTTSGVLLVLAIFVRKITLRAKHITRPGRIAKSCSPETILNNRAEWKSYYKKLLR